MKCTERAEKYLKHWIWTAKEIRNVFENYVQEALTSMECHKEDPHRWQPSKTSLLYLDACINVLPTGKEKGVYYAADVGGTNLRAVRCKFDGNGQIEVSQVKKNLRDVAVSSDLPRGLLDAKATATMLFDEIAAVIKDLVVKEGDKNVMLGLTFSFGIEQKAINQAILTGWGKNWETGYESNDPVVGKDVCMLLNMALDRNNSKTKVAAALNDTVGTMLSGSYCKGKDDPPCLIGLILGTGLNMAYYQPDAVQYGYKGVVINTECGGFDKGYQITGIDQELDLESSNPGRQRLEKLVSGLFIPEMVRLLALKIFCEEAPEAAWVKNSLDGLACSQMYSDDDAPYQTVQQVLSSKWNWHSLSQEHLKVMHMICCAVFNRSAAVCAGVVAAGATLTGHWTPAMGGLTIGIDGSLYVGTPKYQKALKQYLVDTFGEKACSLLRLVIADDGSGKGAAILAGARARGGAI